MGRRRRGAWRRQVAGIAVLALGGGLLGGLGGASSAQAAQPKPGHSRLVPDVPRKDTPRISDGEIWDLEVVGNRVFVAGSFTSIADVSGTTAPVPQRYLAAFNLDTGKVDRTFRPTFNGGVSAVEATPDGSKLFVGGTFNTVNGVAAQKVASLNLSTGTPVPSFGFAQSTNNAVTALAATDSTLYVGGRFSRVNGVVKSGLAAVATATGTVQTGFANDVTGGIGVNGALAVQQLKLTHDDGTLLVVHTGRQIAGQDRLGIGLINTRTQQLLPWRTRLWDDNLARVGGVTRIYAADIAPDDRYFVVGSGSGGDAPPISDTVVAYPMTGGDDVQPLWITRCFDSIYSVAITEQAVYVGGHFSWNESPTANQPWPGLDNVGYGTGQGLSGYGLGDQVVRRDHLGALDPATGTALEWNPGSNSFEGNKAMEATARGLLVGGDGMFQGAVRTGRVAFYDFASLPAAASTDTTISTPIEGRVVPTGAPFTIDGTASNPQGIKRVQVELQDRDTGRYLQDDGVTWGAANSINATLGTGTTRRGWSLSVTVTGNRRLKIMAKTFGSNGTNDATKAVKTIESFGLDDQTPTTSITGPSGVQTSTTFTMTGTASDDKGVSSLTYWFRDESNNYLQADGTLAPVFATFRGVPDVIGATSATWSTEVTLPHEGVWRGSATAVDTTGQADLRSATRDFTVNSDAVAPVVTINQPVAMAPPIAAPSVLVAPGSPITFSGTASDDSRLKNVEITLRNSTTRENLGADGSWGVTVTSGRYRISPVNINAATYTWTYTTPFALSPGTYGFTVRATDDDDLSTSSVNQGKLTVLAQVPGDNPPDGLLDVTGTQTATSPNLPLAGTATDDQGVQSVKLTIFDNATGRYLQPNGTLGSGYAMLAAALAAPGATSTTWSLPVLLPGSGDYSVTALAFDTAGQQDGSTTGATARYRYFPGDAVPGFEAALGQPVDGTTFNQGKIVVTGRAVDDVAIARVDVAVLDAQGRYMSSTGTFTSTTESWRASFINSPGSPGSNYSYTTPVIPDGSYTVLVRPTDNRDQVGPPRVATGIVVTHPVNAAPVARATVSCQQNVCSFDGRASTDENPASLVYAWSFGAGQGTASGPVPTRTYSAPGTFTVTLTVKDEWTVTASTTLSVPIVEPAGNVAPTPVLAFGCQQLACSVSSTGTTDPNSGDTVAVSWAWGDGTPSSTGTSATHSYAVPGTYPVTLTATDGWGRTASTTRQIVLAEPAGNRAPTIAFSASCTALACQTNSAGTSDPDGDALRFSWSWGDGTPASTAASPAHTYAAAGSYQVTLTVTDGWNRAAALTRTVSVP